MNHASNLLAATLLALPACGGGIAPAGAEGTATPVPAASATQPSAVTRPAIGPWDATRCGDDDYRNARMERHPALMSLAPDTLEAAYGAVASRETFRVGEPAGTFYGELGRRRAGQRHPQAGAQAQALTWTKQGCNFSVFFVEQNRAWRAVNAFEWSVGADF